MDTDGSAKLLDAITNLVKAAGIGGTVLILVVLAVVALTFLYLIKRNVITVEAAVAMAREIQLVRKGNAFPPDHDMQTSSAAAAAGAELVKRRLQDNAAGNAPIVVEAIDQIAKAAKGESKPSVKQTVRNIGRTLLVGAIKRRIGL